MLYNFKKTKKTKKTRNGSVLIFTLFIMIVSLVAGIGIISVSNFDRQSSISTVKTVNSFQLADTGLERSLFRIKGVSSTKKINDVPFFSSCMSGEITKIAFNSFGKYTITFYDNNGTKLQCTDLIGDIKTIKSVGKYEGINRAVKVTLP